MATIYRATGTGGEGSTDKGTVLPLSEIESRLGARNVRFLGASKPTSIKPETEYFDRILVKVSEFDPQSAKFPQRPGYYLVINLAGTEAQRLFPEPPDPCAPEE